MSSTFRCCSKIRVGVVLHHNLHRLLQGPGGALHSKLCRPQWCLVDTLVLSIMLYLSIQARTAHTHARAHQDAVLPAGSKCCMCLCATGRATMCCSAAQAALGKDQALAGFSSACGTG